MFSVSQIAPQRKSLILLYEIKEIIFILFHINMYEVDLDFLRQPFKDQRF